jgi:hypothetical protein
MVRCWFSNTPAANVYLTVAGYNPTNYLLTVVNTGLTPGVAGMVVSSSQIYLGTYSPEQALIAGNVIDSGAILGMNGISCIAKGRITGNFIRGYRAGVGQYDTEDLYPSTRYTVIDSNVILTRNPTSGPYCTYGIVSYGPQDIIFSNLVIIPISTTCIGISLMGTGSWVEANTVLAQQVVHYGYGSANRAVGIDIGNPSTGSTSAANRTCGFDVGIGPDPYQSPPHRVLSHFSTNDVLAVDPLGLPSP